MSTTPALSTRLINAVSPEMNRAMERVATRFSQGLVRRLPDNVVNRMADTFRGWMGATTGPMNQNWRPSQNPVNADIVTDLPTLSARGKDNYRNTPTGWRACDELTLSTVGTGIWPRFDVQRGTEARRLKRSRVLQEWFNEWSDVCWPMHESGFAGIQDVAARECFSSGNVLVRLGYSNAKLTAGVPLYLDVYPARLLCPMNDTHGTKNKFNGVTVNGIAYNAVGRPLAYYLWDNDPKDISQASLNILEIPADEIIHLYRPTEAGQSMGTPITAPIMDTVHKRTEYIDATLNRKTLESAIVAFLTGVNPADVWKNTTQGVNAKPPRALDRNGQPIGMMQPGSIISVENGHGVTLSNPSSQSDYAAFNAMVMHDMSAGTGIPYNRLTGDVTGASFSGERIAMLPYARQIEVWAQVYLMPILIRRVVRAWVDAAYLKGIVEFGDFDQFGHVPVQWVYAPIVQADQMTQLNYDIGRVRSGFATRDDCVIAQGGDPTRIDAQRKIEQESWDAQGLVYDCDPRRYAKSGNPVTPYASSSGAAEQGNSSQS